MYQFEAIFATMKNKVRHVQFSKKNDRQTDGQDLIICRVAIKIFLNVMQTYEKDLCIQ